MRNHVYITAGLVMLGIFLWRAREVLSQPGIGLAEAYVFGGFALACALIVTGLRGWLASRQAQAGAPPRPTSADHTGKGDADRSGEDPGSG